MRMTRDEVMALTDDQLAVKVAELLGWEDVAWREVNNLLGSGTFKALCAKPDSGPGGDEDAVGWLVGDGKDMFDVVPDYPNDIVAGFTELIPMIIRATSHPDREEAETIAIKYYSENCPPFVGGPWAVNMIKDWHPSSFGGYAPIYIEIGGERPEQAITRAFILAMEENHE